MRKSILERHGKKMMENVLVDEKLNDLCIYVNAKRIRGKRLLMIT
jgi:hypothetical protein